MMPTRTDDPPAAAPARRDGHPRLVGRFGSLDAFWRLIEPILDRLGPRRVCEVGVEKGIFTARLLAWGRAHRCAYVGIDPVALPEVAALVEDPAARQEGVPGDRLLAARSLDVLPGLERCEAYFLDGDHNYHTLRQELELIARAATPGEAGTGPVIFMHDVGWPFGRRDMYHDPAGIPAEARQEYSGRLGISLKEDELIDGGIRSPGQYAVATHPGGPRNGVLTAVEDFLAGDAGRGWQLIVVPVAYGLAILYRPDDDGLPPACRDGLDRLRAAVAETDGFLESCEANFLTMYLYSEHAGHELGERTRALSQEQGAHFDTLEAYTALEHTLREVERVRQRGEEAHQETLGAYKNLEGAAQRDRDALTRTLEAYDTLEKAYGALENTCQGLTSHNEASAQEYARLQSAYTDLSGEYRSLLDHCHTLQRYNDYLVSTATPPPDNGAAHPVPAPIPAAESRRT